MTQIPRGKVFGRSQAAKQSSRVFFMIDNLLMCWGIQKECNVYNPSQSFLTTGTLSRGQLEMLSWPYLGVEHSSEPFPGFSTHWNWRFPFLGADGPSSPLQLALLILLGMQQYGLSSWKMSWNILLYHETNNNFSELLSILWGPGEPDICLKHSTLLFAANEDSCCAGEGCRLVTLCPCDQIPRKSNPRTGITYLVPGFRVFIAHHGLEEVM